MNKLKRTLALLTATATVLAFSSVAAFAEDEAAAEEAVEIVEVEEEAVETEAGVEVFTANVLPDANGGVITLVEDVTLSSLAVSTTTEIDLNGFTLCVDSTITVSADLTISDLSAGGTGVLQITDLTSALDLMQVSANNISVVINGGTLKGGCDVVYAYGVSDTTLTINGGTLDATAYSGGEASTARFVYCDGTKVTVNGGALLSQYVNISLDTGSTNSEVYINGGYFSKTYYNSSYPFVLNAPVTYKSGCEWTYVADGTYAGSYTVAEVTGDDVATVNGVGYPTLRQAFLNASDGDTVVLADDLTVPQIYGLGKLSGADVKANVTFDLNGKTLTIDDTNGSNFELFMVHKGAQLTLVDSVGTGLIDITASGPVFVKNYGAFVMESGAIQTVYNAINSSPYYIYSSEQNAKTAEYVDTSTTINGGSLTTVGNSSNAVRISNASGNTAAFTVNGGTFTNDSFFLSDVTAEINGGTFESPDIYASMFTVTKGSTGTTLIISGGDFSGRSEIINLSAGSVVITDGTFETTEDDVIYVSYSSASLEITGGTFTASGSGDSVIDGRASASNVSITGGTFSEDVSSYISSESAILTLSGTEYVVITSTQSSSTVASTINVEFEKVSDGVYDINLVGAGGTTIYRFLAAELTFALDTTDAVSYEIAAADGIEMTEKDGVYEFNLTSAKAAEDYAITGNTVTIGQVTFAGIGTVNSFGVTGTDSMAQTAVYNATDNNLLRTYIIGGTDSVLTCTVLTDVELTLDTTTLTINVMFPNSVENKTADYENMSVTYNNLTLTDAVTIDLGSDTVTYTTIDSTNGWSGYVYTVDVPVNYTTTLTFAGDGYRTYRTSIVPTGKMAASVTVWNNAMDSDETIVTVGGDDEVTESVTFLAGDIVMDYTINLYDLSAVTSYFGKVDLTSADTTDICYDLNRDGKIDSKDIAMVLVSWGE